MAKKTNKPAAPEIEAQLETEAKQINETFREMVSAIDQYLRISPMQFLDGQESSPGEYLFPDPRSRFTDFEDWMEHCMSVLYPRTVECKQNIDVGTADEDDYNTMLFDVQRFGFLVGFLVGIKTTGASDDEALHRVEGFTINNMGWQRWRAMTAVEKGKARR
jgi:hypothetical protein